MQQTVPLFDDFVEGPSGIGGAERLSAWPVLRLITRSNFSAAVSASLRRRKASSYFRKCRRRG